MCEKHSTQKFEKILQKSFYEIQLSRSEITYLLGLKDKSKISLLFRTAQSLRGRYFGNRIFLYGFVYFSTFCRNDCTFCSCRKSNRLAFRYRKSETEIIEAACLLAESGVHLIDLTMGEDPFYYRNERGLDSLLSLIRKVKELTDLPVMVSPGVLPDKALVELARSGADWYACYQETHNRRLFAHLRPDQNYDLRFSSKIFMTQLGMLIEEGIMTGVGESFADIANSMEAIRLLGAQQARVMSFVPQTGTPMSTSHSPSRLKELKVIAVLRLLFPDRLIPASLDVDGLDLLQERLDAGANVITSLIPPRLGLSGVSQPFLGIDEGYRTVGGVRSLLDRLGMDIASREDYSRWVVSERSSLARCPSHDRMTA